MAGVGRRAKRCLRLEIDLIAILRDGLLDNLVRVEVVLTVVTQFFVIPVCLNSDRIETGQKLTFDVELRVSHGVCFGGFDVHVE